MIVSKAAKLCSYASLLTFQIYLRINKMTNIQKTPILFNILKSPIATIHHKKITQF